MYANGFDTPKDNCLNGAGVAFEFFFGFEFESLFSIWKFLVFTFSKKNNQSSQKEDSCSGLL